MHFLNSASSDNFLNKQFYGESATNYLWFAGIIVATLLLKKYAAHFLTWVSTNIASTTGNLQHKKQLREMLLKPVERLVQIILFFVAVNRLSILLDRVVIYHSVGKQGQTVIKLGDVAEHAFLLLFIIFFYTGHYPHYRFCLLYQS